MKTKKAFAVSVGIIVSTFILFVVLYGNYVHDREQTRVNNHSRVIASAMWDFEAEGIMEYLRLACNAYKYGHVQVTQDSGEIFIDIDNSLQKSIDRFLIILNLIPAANLISDVVYNQKVIGKISVTWYNTAVYIYLYALMLVFLIVTVLWYYLRTITAKHELEARVEERTADLREQIAERERAEEALMESQERFMNLIENAVMGIYQVTKEGKFIMINQRMVDMFGFPSQKEFLATIENIKELYFHPEERPKILREINEKGFIEGKEVEFKRKDGESIWNKLYTRVTENKEGIILYEGLMEDITERKVLEEQLRQSHKMEAIGTLAGGIAHDFNNILGIILGNTELAMDDVPEWNPARLNLKEVRTASLRAKDVVRQLLSFARKTELEKKPINITPIVKESLKLLRSSIPTSIEIRQDIPEDIDTILADPTQINQVLINLCTNAAHAMPNGGVLEIKLENVKLGEAATSNSPDLNPGRYLNLTVSDTGYGINPKDIDRIFDPYFTTKEVGRGTGMGLAVIHGIIKGHGASVSVQSQPGKGTTFSIFFPVVEADAIVETETVNRLSTGSEKILFVDDEESMIKMGQQILGRLGYKPEIRANPVEALELFRSDPDLFDLVITDMTMPQMSGDKLAKEILNIRPDMPVILCTGFSEKVNEESAKEMGISAFVLKPIVMRDIAHTIRMVLDKK